VLALGLSFGAVVGSPDVASAQTATLVPIILEGIGAAEGAAATDALGAMLGGEIAASNPGSGYTEAWTSTTIETKTYDEWVDLFGAQFTAPSGAPMDGRGEVVGNYPVQVECSYTRFLSRTTSAHVDVPGACGLGARTRSRISGSPAFIHPEDTWLEDHGWDPFNDVDEGVDPDEYENLAQLTGADCVDMEPAQLGLSTCGLAVTGSSTWARTTNLVLTSQDVIAIPGLGSDLPADQQVTIATLGTDIGGHWGLTVVRSSTAPDPETACQYWVLYEKAGNGGWGTVNSSGDTLLPCPQASQAIDITWTLTRVGDGEDNIFSNLYINGVSGEASPGHPAHSWQERGVPEGPFHIGSGQPSPLYYPSLPESSAVQGVSVYPSILPDAAILELAEQALTVTWITSPVFDDEPITDPDPEVDPEAAPTTSIVPTPTTVADPDPEADPEASPVSDEGTHGFLRWIGQGIWGLFDHLTNLFHWLLNGITELFRWLISELWRMFQWLWEKLLGILSAMLQVLNSIWAKLQTVALILKDILAAITEMLGQVVAALAGIPARIAAAIQVSLQFLFDPGDPPVFVMPEFDVPTLTDPEFEMPDTSSLVDTCESSFPCSWVQEGVQTVDAIKTGVNGHLGDACGPSIGFDHQWGHWQFEMPSPPGCPQNGTAYDSQAFNLWGYRSMVRLAASLVLWLGFAGYFVRQLPWSRNDEVPGEAMASA
jgi:hypothetical protein